MIQIERITRQHVREDFDCGESSLNNYIQRNAVNNDEQGVGRTFVAVNPDDPHILGYYTLASGKVAYEHMPPNKKLPPYPVPVVLLGRLAVDKSQQGNRLGEYLLLHALWRSQMIAKNVGVYAVEVDALHDRAARFYLRYGFTPLLDNPLHLYLSMKTIEALSLEFHAE